MFARFFLENICFHMRKLCKKKLHKMVLVFVYIIGHKSKLAMCMLAFIQDL